ncbi:MAG TPA: hypothetical protein VLF63_01835 [Patescibacteria group bacterium]|nr:hypothetical protein [Patescibacteria group bacterium]
MEEIKRTPCSNADKTVEVVDEFLKHLHDDLPLGPLSQHGNFIADRFLIIRSEAEIRRLAVIGKMLVDERTSSN